MCVARRPRGAGGCTSSWCALVAACVAVLGGLGGPARGVGGQDRAGLRGPGTLLLAQRCRAGAAGGKVPELPHLGGSNNTTGVPASPSLIHAGRRGAPTGQGCGPGVSAAVGTGHSCRRPVWAASSCPPAGRLRRVEVRGRCGRSSPAPPAGSPGGRRARTGRALPGMRGREAAGPGQGGRLKGTVLCPHQLGRKEPQAKGCGQVPEAGQRKEGAPRESPEGTSLAEPDRGPGEPFGLPSSRTEM